MYALMNIDTEEYLSTFTSKTRVGGLEAHFSGDMARAKRWKSEDGARESLDRLYDKGIIPQGCDVRVVEVEDVW